MENIYFKYSLEELREIVAKEPSNRKAKEALCMKIAEDILGDDEFHFNEETIKEDLEDIEESPESYFGEEQ